MKKNTFPRKEFRDRAVALKHHKDEDGAPRVVAKGEGVIAQKIRATAQEHGVPLYRDDDLLELLSQVEINQEIPAELYAAVAEVLAWLYRVNNGVKNQKAPIIFNQTAV